MRSAARGDELVDRILQSPAQANDLANDLLEEFYGGYPIVNLSLLLNQEHEEVVQAGVWIASEIPGSLGKELTRRASSFMFHRRAEIRFLAIDVVLDNVPDDGEVLAVALGLIRDPDGGVRWKAMRFATLADDSQLEWAAAFLSTDDRARLRASGLLRDDATPRTEAIQAGLASSDGVLRRWSGAAAARIGSEDLLKLAVASRDEEVSTFAGRELSRLRRFGPARRVM